MLSAMPPVDFLQFEKVYYLKELGGLKKSSNVMGYHLVIKLSWLDIWCN